jgi:hypothetical protein
MPLAATLALVCVSACAVAPTATPASDAEVECAVVLTTVADWPQLERLSEAAARQAGTPVSRTSAIGPRSFALVLRAGNDAQCQQAVASLGADPGFAAAVLPDHRRTLPRRPTPASTL